MNRRKRIAKALTGLAMGLLCTHVALAEDISAFDSLYADLFKAYYSSQKDKDTVLEKLKALQPTFTSEQNEKYQLAYASSLGYRGRHEERIALVESILGQVKTPARRVRFLFELIDGNTALGRYEQALQAMNESILLLPALEKTSQKIAAFNGAFNLLNSLHAYDEALGFAERIYALRKETTDSYAECIGLADKVEANYMRGSHAIARTLVRDAIKACETNKSQFFTLMVKALAAIDVVDTGDHAKGISTGDVPLVVEG